MNKSKKNKSKNIKWISLFTPLKCNQPHGQFEAPPISGNVYPTRSGLRRNVKLRNDYIKRTAIARKTDDGRRYICARLEIL